MQMEKRMGADNKETLYLKVDKNTLAKDRNVKLSDVATLLCTDQSITRQLKQMKIYSFSDAKDAPKEQEQVFSVMKLIELIQKEYPNVEVNNIGEMDFIVEYKKNGEPPKWLSICKAAVLTVIIFFGGAFTIMAFNNDISVTELFSKFYTQVMGKESNGFTELEICYSIGLSIGVLLFFNHFGNKKITHDPTPVQVEMRKYEKDVDDTFIETAERGGTSIDVD